MLAPASLAVLALAAAQSATAALTDDSLAKKVDSLELEFEFNPVKEAYWTGLPHHRRTPFAVSPDGKSAYLAYLDSSETDVHIQQVDPSTFTATGTTVTVKGGKEAGGLVAHNDGFALLTNEAMPSGTSNAPADSTPVPVMYRYTSGKQTWKTWLGGPDVHADQGLAASPDMNGDLVYSSKAGMYGAYFVVTDYSGDASGHFGDSIQYVQEDGTLKTIAGASSAWGCSHNTGIAFEEADEAPFASICAEDQGDIWLNTKTQGMSSDGVKISNENTTNGATNEAMGGMSGSYSNLARFADSAKYIFSWVSRGATDLHANEWMGDGYVSSLNRTNNRNVAIAILSDKATLAGEQATSEVGAKDGDSQVNWVTQGSNDCSNAHAAAFDASTALVTWEEAANPQCDNIAMGCAGEFAGSFFQLYGADGTKQGEALKSTDTYVAGDMVTMSDGRICWPYVSMDWSLSAPAGYGYGGASSSSTTKKMSFACMAASGSAGTSSSSSSSGSSSAAAAAKASTTAAAAAAATPVAEKAATASADVAAVQSTAQAQQATTLATQVRASAAATSSAAAVESTPAAAGSWPWSGSAQQGMAGSGGEEPRTEGEEGPCHVEYVWV